MSRFQDLTGQRFGRLVVIERAEDYISPKGAKRPRWLCQCDCGNKKIVIGDDLRSKKTLSCGCLLSEHTVQMGYNNKKYNEYDLTGAYGVGYTRKGEPFYFDLEDYDKIKEYCWSKNKKGYLRANGLTKNNRVIFMHQLLCVCPDNMVPDHYNRNKADNRKSNLIPSTFSENIINKDVVSSNTSGFTGVCWHKQSSKWRAYITYNKNIIHLGAFVEKKEAIIARLKAEKKFFKEKAPQRHLFKEYGIE